MQADEFGDTLCHMLIPRLASGDQLADDARARRVLDLRHRGQSTLSGSVAATPDLACDLAVRVGRVVHEFMPLSPPARAPEAPGSLYAARDEK